MLANRTTIQARELRMLTTIFALRGDDARSRARIGQRTRQVHPGLQRGRSMFVALAAVGLANACASIPLAPEAPLVTWAFTAPWDARSDSSVRAHRSALAAIVSGWIQLDSATGEPALPYRDAVPRIGSALRFALLTSYQHDRFHADLIRRLAADSVALRRDVVRRALVDVGARPDRVARLGAARASTARGGSQAEQDRGGVPAVHVPVASGRAGPGAQLRGRAARRGRSGRGGRARSPVCVAPCGEARQLGAVGKRRRSPARARCGRRRARRADDRAVAVGARGSASVGCGRSTRVRGRVEDRGDSRQPVSLLAPARAVGREHPARLQTRSSRTRRRCPS